MTRRPSNLLLSIQRRPPPPRPSLLSLLLLFLFFLLPCFTSSTAAAASTLPHEITRGFSANPSSNPLPPLPSSSSLSFQPILADPSGNFSLGFLLSSIPDQPFDLAVVHLSSALPVWRASSPATHATLPWSHSTSLSFNGSLILSDPSGAVLWSSGPPAGDRVVLLGSSNLQIQELSGSVVWQSFDSPFDTLVQDQNLTSSAALFSADRRYSMRLGTNYLALYMVSDAAGGNAAMYWKATALQERAEIVEGGGPIYARVEPLGFLGLYQNEKARVHVLPFDTFNRGIPGFRRITLETDGNLRAYYWNTSSWAPDFTAISDVCKLPAYCGAYGLCTMGKGECGCLDGNRKGDGCLPEDAGDLCSGADRFWELRRTGVELSYKDLLVSEEMGSREECELGCERNCSCWGALYNNATGSCYRMGFPVGTLLAAGDDNRVGYFKVRAASSDGGKKGRRGPFGGGGGVALLVVGLLVVAVVAMLGAYRLCERRRRYRGGAGGALIGESISPGPYKEFRDSASFRAIELSISSSSSSRG